jgi:hypothetical protein
MAEKKVNIDYRVKDNASKPIGKIKLSTIALGNAIGVLAVAAVKKLIASFSNMLTVAGIQEKAVNDLNEAMIRNGSFTAEASRRAQEFASELQRQTTVGDEAILSTQALLTELADLSGNGLEKATEATLDLSSRLGIDLKAAAQLVGKSIGSSTNALSRYGIQVEGAVGSTDRLDSAVDQISTKFGGAAKAEAKTYQGQVKQLKNELGDLQEKIGFLIIQGILPAIKFIKEWAIATNDGFNNIVKNIKLALVSIVEFFEITKAVFNKFRGLFKKNKEDEKSLEGAILQIKANAAKKRLDIVNDTNKKTIDAEKNKNDEIRAQENKRLIDAQKAAEERIKLEEEANKIIKAASKSAFEHEKGLLAGYLDFAKRKAIAAINVHFSQSQAELIGTIAANWWNPVGWGSIAALAGLEAQKQGAIAVVKAINFEDGGIVPGTSFSGDNVSANVNSGEMILNRQQQRTLFNIANQSLDIGDIGGGGSSTQSVIILDSDGSTMLAKGIYQKTTDMLRTGALQERR